MQTHTHAVADSGRDRVCRANGRHCAIDHTEASSDGEPRRIRVASDRTGYRIKVREHCGSIGGCAIYGSLIPDGATSAEEVLLDARGRGLPQMIEAGAYVVRFRLAAVSDDLTIGVPPEETTAATCEGAIDVSFQSRVNLKAVFRRASCRVTGTYTFGIID